MDSKIEFIDEYINKIDEITGTNKTQLTNDYLCEEIIKVFSNDIANIVDGISTYVYFDDNYDYKKDLFLLKSKLKKLKVDLISEKEHMRVQSRKNDGIIIQNINTNTNTQNINISFEEARETIKKIDYLDEDEITDVLKKIDEIEKIIQSNKNKATKWEAIKPFLLWIANKGVDVGITLLPLLLNIK